MKEYKISTHITQGVKYVIPVILLYSIVLALANIENDFFNFLESVPPYILMLMPVLLAFFISKSISNKALYTSLLVGLIAGIYELSFLGGILSGFLVGYLYLFIQSKMKNRILVEIITLIISGLVVYFFIRIPLLYLLDSISNYIRGINKTEVILIVALLAGLMVIDLGGPFNKLAFSLNIEFFLDEFYHITGPILISVIIPPLTALIALYIFKNRFSDEDKKTNKFLIFSSVFGMTEGAIFIGYRRPLIFIPAFTLGAISASVFAAVLNIENTLLLASIFGIFSVNSIPIFILSHLIGVFISLTILFFIFKFSKVYE